MHVQKIDEFTDFLSVRNEWNALLKRSEQNCLSLTHEWLCSWWEGFGEHADLRVLLIREGEEIVGAAPFMRKQERFRGLPVKTLDLMVNGHTPEGNVILAGRCADSAKCLFEFLYSSRHEWSMLKLQKIPLMSKFTGLLEDSVRRNGFFHLRNDSLKSPYIDIATDWETYYGGRSKKFHKVMRNKLNRIGRDGSSITVQKICDLPAIKKALSEMFSVSSKSWKATIGQSISGNASVKRFYEKLTDALGEKELVDLWFLRRNGEAIAFEYHIRYEGIVHPIRADFDENHKDLSPGSVLEYHILKNLFEDPAVRGYNSCGHTYDYLMNWATEVIEYVDFQIFNSRAYSKNLYLLESKMIPAAKKAKSLLGFEKLGAKS